MSTVDTHSREKEKERNKQRRGKRQGSLPSGRVVIRPKKKKKKVRVLA